jgi:ATP-dependent Clp protease ATP-binding subunit ClpC
MNFHSYNLTPSAKKALLNAQDLAAKFGHLKIIDMHLLHSLVSQNHSNLAYLFDRVGISKTQFLESLEALLGLYQEPKRKKQIYSPEIKKILEEGFKISEKHNSDYIGSDHLFFGLIKGSENFCVLMEKGGVSIDSLEEILVDLFQNGIPSEPEPEFANVQASKSQNKNFKTLDDCCENLTQKCREKKHPEIFGRDKEINRLYEILLKKNKSNAILVGEAGVGKTAIVEGLAEKIVHRKCPELLLNKEVYCLDVASVVAGTIYRGQMEQNVKAIIDLATSDPNVILFIDEIHTIIGAGQGRDGGLDLANILKPALSRGEISCIGATTKQEYEAFFKQDSALNRRFEKIDIDEPSPQQTVELLNKAKASYESFHMAEYSEEVIDLIVDLCRKHLTNKKFPDKAFDILDESGAKTKISKLCRPQEAIDMEDQLSAIDPSSNTKLFLEMQKKYMAILDKWAQSFKNVKFSVDKDTIYDIFASKLETTPESLKNGQYTTHTKKIGF